MQETIYALSTLGDNAIAAFILSQLLEFAATMTVVFLAAWGVRVAWKAYKENGFRI